MTDKVATKKPKAKAPAEVKAPAKKAPVKVAAKKAVKPVEKKAAAPVKAPVKKKVEAPKLSANELIRESIMQSMAEANTQVAVAPIPERVLTPEEKKAELPTVAPATFRQRPASGEDKITFTDLMAKRGKAKEPNSPFANWSIRSN